MVWAQPGSHLLSILLTRPLEPSLGRGSRSKWESHSHQECWEDPQWGHSATVLQHARAASRDVGASAEVLGSQTVLFQSYLILNIPLESVKARGS